MRELMPGYGLTREELEIERGVGTDHELIIKHADAISSKWSLKPKDTVKPSLLLLGGFQGSGKTTTLAVLSEKRWHLPISPDEIIYNLLADDYKGDFRAVSAIKFELTKRALRTGFPIVIEQSISPDRIKLAQEVIDEVSPNYNLLSVYLYAPIDLLKDRILKRPQIKERYKGTLEELERSTKMFNMRYGNPLDCEYNLKINTLENDPVAVAGQILDLYQQSGL